MSSLFSTEIVALAEVKLSVKLLSQKTSTFTLSCVNFSFALAKCPAVTVTEAEPA